jgi:hypothetical protein
MKDSFLIYTCHYPSLQLLSLEEKGILLDAIYLYHIDGSEPNLASDTIKLAFSFLKQQFDRDAEKYSKIVERNRQNGKVGGRPKNPVGYLDTLGFQRNPVKPQKADNDNDNDNVNESNIFKNQLLISINEIEEFMLSDRAWIECVCLQNNLDIRGLKLKLHNFTDKLRADNVKEKYRDDIFSHFSNWLNVNRKNKRRDEPEQQIKRRNVSDILQ